MWGPHLLGQMARIGVESVPIALFIATFTGIVLALQASYTFTGAVPLYFVGALVGKTMILELGPVLTGLVALRTGGCEHRGRDRHDAGDGADRCSGDARVRSLSPISSSPRVLAGAIMFPMVVILSIAIGILAGLGDVDGPPRSLVCPSSCEGPAGSSSSRGTFSSPPSNPMTFGMTVTAVGCSFGFHTRGGAEGVGQCHDPGRRHLQHDHPRSRCLLGGRAAAMKGSR